MQRAHRLHGRRVVGVAERQRHELLDETGARAARGRRLGVGAHVVERGEALVLDGARDLALAHAVAAADLCVIGQRCNGRHRVQRGPSLIGLAEDQRVAHVGDVDLLLLQVVEPRAVGSLAVEHGADDAVVLQDEPLVDAGRSIAQHDLLAILAVGEVAEREEIDARDLQLGRRVVVHERRGGIARQVRGGDACHLVERRDEAVDMAAHLGAFADREDVGIGGVHAAIDEDAAVRWRGRLACRCRRWAECRRP